MCDNSGRRCYKEISTTIVSNFQAPILKSVPCTTTSLTETDCGNTVNEDATNSRYLVNDLLSVPDLTAIPTTTALGAHWNSKNVFTGMGLSTDKKCKPEYQGGKKFGEFYDQLTKFSESGMHNNSRVTFNRKLKNCETSEYEYYGSFLAFRNDDEEGDDDEDDCNPKHPFWRYVGLKSERKTYKSKADDINKLVLVSQMLDENGIPSTKNDHVILVNAGYSNRKPQTFPITPNSNISAFITSNPDRFYNAIYEARVNTAIYNEGVCDCDDNLITSNKKVVLNGDDVDGDTLNFRLVSSQDSLSCADAPECAVPDNLELTYCATPLKENHCKCEDTTDQAKLNVYLKQPNLTQNFRDGFSEGKVKTIYLYGGTNSSRVYYNDNRNTYGFSSILNKSRYKYDPRQNMKTTDNIIRISLSVPA